MAATKPPIVSSALTAWGDAFRAISAMPVVAGVAFAIVLAIALFSLAVMPNPSAAVGNPWYPLVMVGFSAVSAALLAPLAIVVHRFVLLGETTSRYPLEPASPRYQRFVGFTLLVKFLWLAPNLLQSLVAAVSRDPVVTGVVGVAVFVAEIALIIVLLRRAILFPAIAVDAPGATWSKAGQDTKGSSWRVAFIFLLTSLPMMVVGGGLFVLLLGVRMDASRAQWLAFSLISAVFEVPALAAFAAAASHVFRARADAMNRGDLGDSAELLAG